MEFSKEDFLEIQYQDGEPCKHTGCINHITHPCESCGRITAKGYIFKNPFEYQLEKDFKVNIH
jgi:hypothetical protein